MGTEHVSDTDRSNGRQETAQPWGEAAFLPAVLFLATLSVGAALRLLDLPHRSMHCDEAVHAIKFGELLERGEYKYSPHEYHGPTLNYLTLPVAWLSWKTELADITEAHLRLVPAICGVLAIALVWLVRKELGTVAALCAALLTAVSPAMVFYSRYYIQEMLLVCFTLAAIVAWWRFLHSSPRGMKPYLWLVLLGVSIALMHATKETSIIALFAMAVASLGAIGCLLQVGGKRLAVAAIVVVVTAACVSPLLFSSFGRNPQGLFDSIATYFHYLERAAGEGTANEHVHWWGYYLQILFWWREEGGPLWTEAAIAGLALVGLAAGFMGRGLDHRSVPLVRFLGIYTLVMIVVYSLIPYKTPWCVVGFLHGAILLAGVGMAVLVRAAPGYILKVVVILVLFYATRHLAWQAYRASFVDCEDPRNPYVYSPTSSDVPDFAAHIREIALGHPDGKAMHVQVMCPEADFWPLPWYLRDLSRVGWFTAAPDERTTPAPLIITKPELEPWLMKYLYVDQPPGHRHLYVQLPPKADGTEWTLRPLVPLSVYAQRDFWLEYQAKADQPER
jgi:uncharacterized protein (TIGR03663 family)